MDGNKSIKNWITAISCILLLVFADQYTKLLAIKHLKDQSSFVLLENVFELRYLENRGAAFGMMQNQMTFFIIITFIMLICICFFYAVTPNTKKYMPLNVCMIFISSGAIGNFIDRIFRGFVVDFFYFSLIDFPIFNVADIYVTVTFIVLVLLLFFYYKEEDLDIYSLKTKKSR